MKWFLCQIQALWCVSGNLSYIFSSTVILRLLSPSHLAIKLDKKPRYTPEVSTQGTQAHTRMHFCIHDFYEGLFFLSYIVLPAKLLQNTFRKETLFTLCNVRIISKTLSDIDESKQAQTFRVSSFSALRLHFPNWVLWNALQERVPERGK